MDRKPEQAARAAPISPSALSSSTREDDESHSSAQYELSMDEKEQLNNLTLLSTLSIHDEQDKEQPLRVYINPTDLIAVDYGIPPERLEIAMLQLRHHCDTKQDDAPALNDLACVYALLGRYKEAKKIFDALVAGPAANDLETIENNRSYIEEIVAGKKSQEYWGTIGDPQ